MLCSSCGNDNAAAVSFCEFCGINLQSPSPVPVQTRTVVSHPPNSSTTEAAAAAAALAGAGKTLIKSLTLGEKFSAAGAVAATIGFFLPFVASPNLGTLGDLMGGSAGAATSVVGALTHASFSLLDFSKFWGVIYFILIAALGSAVLFWISRQAPPSRKFLISGFQVMIGSLVGPWCVLSLLFVPAIQTVSGIGFWMTGLGFCCIAVGGLVTIAELGKLTR